MRTLGLQIIKKAAFTLALALGLAAPLFSTPASAADLFSGAKGEACAGAQLQPDAPTGTDLKNCTAGDENTLTDTLKTVLNLLTMVVGIMTIIMLIISGIRFVTSHGDSNSITSARNTFIYALVGLIVVAFAQIIVKLVLSKIGS